MPSFNCGGKISRVTRSFLTGLVGLYNRSQVVEFRDICFITKLEAKAGKDKKVQVGDTVTLDGSESIDQDRNELTYSWMLTSVPPGSTASLSDATSPQPTFTVDLPVGEGTPD